MASPSNRANRADSADTSHGGADTALRGLTEDGAFRVMVVQTTETVRGAIAAQHVHGHVARLFAEMLTGSILVRETMSPELRVQGILQGGDGKSRIIADVHPGGDTRGLVQLAPGKADIVLDHNARMQMMRTLHDGSLHQGVVSVPKGGGVSGALMQYMQASEQVTSVIAVGCVMSENNVIAAGGYIVQLLPELAEGPLALMTERLTAFESIDSLLARGAAAPATLLDELLYGIPYARVGESPLRFHCPCSEARVAASLATLPRADVESLLVAGQMLDIQCDYCGREYQIAPETLRGLLSSN